MYNCFFLLMWKLDALLADLRVSVPVHQLPSQQTTMSHENSLSTSTATIQSGLLPNHGPVVSCFAVIEQML